MENQGIGNREAGRSAEVTYEELAYVVTSRRKHSPRFDKSLYEMPVYGPAMPEGTFGEFTVFARHQDAEKALARLPSPESWEVRPVLMRFASPEEAGE